ncbi:MAG: ribosome silencing factor [Acutalibacteraceae bacterium]
MDALEKAKIAVKALDSKRARDIEVIKITDLSSLGDYLVLASGTSSTHVKALADEVEYKISETGEEPDHVEGKASNWILLDYSSVMVHVFHTSSREFYQLDRLWADGERIDISDLVIKEENQQ